MMLGSGGVLVGSVVLIGNLSGNVKTDNLLGDSRNPEAARVALEGPINMLLLGTDRRKGWSAWQSDTIIMVHIPKEHDRGYLISFQRDTLVDIPPYRAARFGGGQDKLNAAFAYGGRRTNGRFSVAGGFQLMAKTIKEMSGLSMNTGAVIDFQGFLKTVEVLGGVKMCVESPRGTRSFRSIHKPYRTFKKGCQHLSPAEALDYSRQRYQFDSEPGGGDFARMRHQQQLIKAILKQALSKGFDNPTKIPSLIKAAGKSLLLDQSIPLDEMAWAFRGISPDNLTALKVPVYAYNEGGISYQKLDDRAYTLFKAIKQQKLDGWILRNPEYINPV
jgi:LCP family protein required for cell wall assembly